MYLSGQSTLQANVGIRKGGAGSRGIAS